MKHILSYFIMPVLIMAGMVSCNKDAQLSVSVNELNYSANEQKQTVQIMSDASWTASADCEWVICSPAQGSGNATLAITTRRNDGLARKASVTVAGEGGVENIAINQDGVDFIASEYDIVFPATGGAVNVTIASAYDWTISVPEKAAWLSVNPASGKSGETVVTLTPADYSDRTPRDRQFLTVNYNGTFSMISVSQEMPNNPPAAPALLSPEDKAENVKINGTFTWKAAVDPDGDAVSYILMLSNDDGDNWMNYSSETTRYKLSELLSKETRYLWKVKAIDSFGGESVSETRSFTSGDGGAYADGEVSRYQTESANASKPVHLIFMGDGYIKEDYYEGGAFDRDVEKAVEALFSLEPYASYRNYFRISTVDVYSQERGATVLKDMSNCAAQTKNTAFSTVLEGAGTTACSTNLDKAFSYAKKVEGVTDDELKNTTVFMLVNLNVYAGTCQMERSGRSVSICPVGSSFQNIVVHEGGGHGFGRLLDEYVYNPNDAIPASYKNMIADWRSVDPYYAWNISLTNDAAKAPWGHFIGRKGYDSVGFFEGAVEYGRGVWRAEKISCMHDNRFYFNAPSREAIVRRIFKAAGKQFTLDSFYTNDKVKSDNTTKRNYVEMEMAPLAPPVLINR